MGTETTGDGWIDLHLHYVPGVDDGVRTLEEGQALCRGLGELGYRQLVTTPHIRTAMFDNSPGGLRAGFAHFCEVSAGLPGMPELGLGAEHFFDDVFWERFSSRDFLPYPGGHAVLVELPEGDFPLRLEERFFHMRVKGCAPVLAHPERYRPLFRTSQPLTRLVEMGLLLQLDLMSLVGRYGRRPRKAAERMLEEDLYFVACTDAHRVEDLPRVAEALERLHALVGAHQAQQLLAGHPGELLSGTFDP